MTVHRANRPKTSRRKFEHFVCNFIIIRVRSRPIFRLVCYTFPGKGFSGGPIHLYTPLRLVFPTFP